MWFTRSRRPASPWVALVTLASAVLVVGLDLTVLNVALPTLATTIHASTAQLQWIVDAYVLAFAAAMLPAGWLGDRFGRARVLTVGLALFAAMSVLAAYSGAVGGLVAARVGMGLSAAMILPLALSLVPTLFDERSRQRAVTVMVACVGLGLPLGPIVGGFLLERFWWGSVFLVTVPVVVLSLVASLIFLPPDEGRPAAPLDVAGLVTSTGGTTALVYALVEAPDKGWTAPGTLALLAAAALAFVAFAIRQRTARHPLVPASLLRSAVFVRGTTITAVAGFGMTGLLFLLPMHLQLVAGGSTSRVGLELMPFMLALIGAGLTAERVGSRLPLRAVAAGGLFVAAVGFLLLGRTDPTSGYGILCAALALAGFGVGLALAPVMNAVLGSLPSAAEGVGSALNNTARQLAGALGVAVLGAVAAGAYGRGMDGALATLPAPARAAASSSLAGAHVVAGSLPGSAARVLTSAADAAFDDGLRLAMLTCAALLALTAALTPRLLSQVVTEREAAATVASSRQEGVGQEASDDTAGRLARTQEDAHP